MLLRIIFVALASVLALPVVSGAEGYPSNFNPYSILRVPRTADKEALKGAYKRALNVMGRVAAKDGHGQDANPKDIMIMRSIRQAYEVLSDEGRRREWDSTHPAETSPAPGSGGGWQDYEREL